MIVEYIRYAIPADRSAGFLAAYGRAQGSLQASPHCLAYELARCTEAPDAYVLRIEWDSLSGHLEGFRNSPQFQTFLAEVRPYIGDIAEMRHYEPTDARWTRSASRPGSGS
jgi:quinol monooxygenase YgiN